MSSCRLAAPVPPVIVATWPTCTPRIFTFAFGSITKPDGSAVNVTGTAGVKVSLNAATLRAIPPQMASTSMRASHSGAMRRRCRDCVGMALSREVEVAGLTVEGQRDEHDDQPGDGQRCAGGAPHCLADACRSSAGGESVVGVDQHDRRHLSDGDDERPQHVCGDEECGEVVDEDPSGLAEVGGGEKLTSGSPKFKCDAKHQTTDNHP